MKIGVYGPLGTPLIELDLTGWSREYFLASNRVILTDGDELIRFRVAEIEKIEKPEETTESILDSRAFNYYFYINDLVMLDPEIEIRDNKLKPHIGKIGVVRKCWSDLHAYGQGSAYLVVVDFNGQKVETVAGYFIKAE